MLSERVELVRVGGRVDVVVLVSAGTLGWTAVPVAFGGWVDIGALGRWLANTKTKITASNISTKTRNKPGDFAFLICVLILE
jgi:hypothetical protein